MAEFIVNNLIPIAPEKDTHIHFSSSNIKVGVVEVDPFTPFSNQFPDDESISSDQSIKTLETIYPNLQRLITKDWFISLESFSFQWNVETLGENKTLATLARIFEHASQLPNLRIFAWCVDCFYDENENKEEEKEKPLNELPISKDFISKNHLFPRVETMKMEFFAQYVTFVTIPIEFFQSYLG